jgi:predicted metal-dependent phosphotriesterase family hydrolase
MATNSQPAPAAAPTQASTLAQEIEKSQQELVEKQKRLQAIQQSEIDKLVNKFVSDIEKAGFDRVVVKKMVVDKLTRKNKKRS